MIINAKVICDSVSPKGVRLTTLELEYPRFIHAEFMTHRMLSKNASSSRAIPVQAVIDQVRSDPAMPIHWGANQAGMQAREELNDHAKHAVYNYWLKARDAAAYAASNMADQGAHKQIVNRILEPFQMMKVVCSATEWANFLWLRNHEAAQPEIQMLAQEINTAMGASTPTQLDCGEWHLPYVTAEDRENLTFEQCLALSVACCAQVSYRKLDKSELKVAKIYDMLTSGDRIHASPFEHQATPFDHGRPLLGVSHTDVSGQKWSGNFRGWVQHRKLIKGEAKW